MHIDYRPVGETIEYGEDSKAAVIREVKEEINFKILLNQLCKVSLILGMEKWGMNLILYMYPSLSITMLMNRKSFKGI